MAAVASPILRLTSGLKPLAVSLRRLSDVMHYFKNLDVKRSEHFRKLPKVELHSHLDGSVNIELVLRAARRRNIDVPANNVEELREVCRMAQPGDLTDFLSKFAIFGPPITGDRAAIFDMAYLYCQDLLKTNTIYAEARYSPHLLTGDDLQVGEVVEIVSRGLAAGSKDFGVKVRSILCCMRHKPEWSQEVVELAAKYKDLGVVAVDLAGDENLITDTQVQHIAAFQLAEKLGIHRTVHAGENGPAANVALAVDEMKAERIGHGYHVLDDAKLYKRLQAQNIHYECCPISSFYTGAVPAESFTSHALKTYLADGVSCSVSPDDPVVTGHDVCDDYAVCCDALGVTVDDIRKLNINAARASFLPADEKEELVQQLEALYGGR